LRFGSHTGGGRFNALIPAAALGMAFAFPALAFLPAPALAQTQAQQGGAEQRPPLRGGSGATPAYDSQSLAPNYGRPRRPPDPRAAYSGRRATPGRPLPNLEFHPRAPAAARAAQRAPAPVAAPPPPNFAVKPGPPPRRRVRIDEEPYAPLGIALGALRLTPYVDAAAGYDSNPARSRTGEGSALVRAEGGFSLRSDWSRHALRAQAQAGYTRFLSAPDASRPDAEGAGTLTLDITRDAFATLELRGALTTQRPGSPDVPGAAVNQPMILSYGASAGLGHRFGRLEASTALLVDRRSYEDATLSTGGIVPLSADSYTAYGLRGRISYEPTPGVRPFVEVSADSRRRDRPTDGSGFARDSVGVQGRAGAAFELTRTLTGEASAGYGQRRYEDSRLPLLAGPTLDAGLVWSATPLTTIRLRAATEFSETSVANAAGAVVRRVSADVSHALLRNLLLGAGISRSSADFRGVALTETTWAGVLRADYSFTREVVARASYTHERLTSSQPNAGYSAHVFLLGLRLHR
jgi:hypothetical protein